VQFIWKLVAVFEGPNTAIYYQVLIMVIDFNC